MSLTPMMQQYQDAKDKHPGTILLFRMGDFYELFYEDAKAAARVLGLTLTSRDKGENPIPMAGFPYHQLESYLAKLIAAGHRAAVCEQVEDPKLAKGLVKRELTRVVSPGTLTDDALLDPRENNYLAAIVLPPTAKNGDRWAGLAWAELSTGRFLAMTLPVERLGDELARVGPAECLVSDDDQSQWSQQMSGERPTMFTRRPPWAFGRESALSALEKHFQTASLDGFGFCDTDVPGLRAAGAVLDYLSETQRGSLVHMDRLLPYRSGECLEIDEATRRSLEITRTSRSGARAGSLVAAIDRTVTPMGARLLADWVANPLTDEQAIGARLDAVETLAASDARRAALRERLRGMYDLQRLLGRVVTGRASPRDLSFVSRTLAALPELKQVLHQLGNEPTTRPAPALVGEAIEAADPLQVKAGRLAALAQQIELCPELNGTLTSALEDNCPLSSREGGIIRSGYSSELDRLRDLAAGGKEWIARYQAEQARETGIANLKVAYNKVFGYYLEITNSQKDKTPAHYIRKQTTVNAERYVTPELKEYEEQVVTADERAKLLEYELFLALRDEVQGEARRLQATATALAELDVLIGLAELARQHGFVRPRVVSEPVTTIVNGRHPVLDILESQGTFVPNDTRIGAEEGTVILITGPNMAGKSTYIRQVALITLLAQMGSFVPAEEATIGIADRIFARVGASDELSRGQSTFMVEMTETARILNTATANSLVILDEIGRGTSTYDGISLAWAIVEHLHDNIGCRTLFATHYHELTDLAESLSGVRNLNVAVKEWEDHVVFLHKIIPGAADKSYGIHVARLAGVPRSVTERAKQILARLEEEHVGENGKPKLSVKGRKSRRGDLQLTLFAAPEHPIVDQLRRLDVDHLTPVEALKQLAELQSKLSKL